MRQLDKFTRVAVRTYDTLLCMLKAIAKDAGRQSSMC